MSVERSVTTFLFTDIEGSTRKWEQYGDAMSEVIARHDAVLQGAVGEAGGRVFKHLGDGVAAVFDEPRRAVDAALEAQRRLLLTDWSPIDELRVRMGVHAGTVAARDGDFFGPPLNRCARMMAAAHGGQVLASEAVADAVRHDLADGVRLRDLGEHRLRDLSRSEHIFQVEADDLPSEFPPIRSLAAFRQNLPVQLTSFVGRDHDTAALCELLERVRLVTVRGAGGSGKTRFAVHAAAELLDRFPDGVYFVDLGIRQRGESLVKVIAETMGRLDLLAGAGSEAREQSRIEGLADALADRNVLILLDNCEHVVDECARICGFLLEHTPAVKVLATSRETLGLPAEHVFRLAPMAVPAPKASVAELRANPSVQLFVERARAVRPDFDLTPANVAAVVDICGRLDGLPLAIELAAARVRMMPPEQIFERLDDSFRLLSSSSRGTLDRHQTLDTALTWSHDLLDDEERTLLRRLAVFRSGARLEQIEQTCGFEPLDELDVCDLLGRLVDKSLVTVDEGREAARYRMLEVVRQFARRQLMAAGEEAPVRDRHADVYQRLAETERPVERMAGIRALEPDEANLRAAVEWRVRDGDGERAVEMANLLWRFWAETGHVDEGLRWLDAALGLLQAHGTEDEARGLGALAFLASQHGEFGRGLSAAEAAIDMARAVGAKSITLPWTLFRKGQLLVDVGRPAAAESPLEEGARLFEEIDHAYGRSWCTLELLRGRVLDGRAAEAVDPLSELLASARRLEEAIVRGYVATLHGLALALGGAVDDGLLNVEEGIGCLEQIEARFTLPIAMLLAAPVHELAGARKSAVDLVRHSLQICRSSGAVHTAVTAVDWSGRLAAAAGDHQGAAELAGAADALRADFQITAPALAVSLGQPARAASLEALGAEHDRCRQRGARLSLAEAVNAAIERLGSLNDVAEAAR